MTREVCFQLVGEDGKAVTAVDCVDFVDDAKVFRLRDAVKEKFKDSHLAGIAPSDLSVFANGVAFEAKQRMDARDALPGDERNVVIVQVPTRQRSEPRGLVGTSLTYADGINPASIHFPRDPLLTRMAKWMTGEEGKNRFLLLNSPAASGKTSLLILFQHKYPDSKSVYISLKEDGKPWDLLLRFGLDIRTRTCAYDHVIYMLDDAQWRYDDPSFWAVLIKDAPLYFGAGVRFIISATHVISTQDQSSPVHFQALETITRQDLLLSDEQSLVLLSSEQPLGLATCLQPFSELKETIIEHCNGLIGALCKSVSFYADQFRHHRPTEGECLRAFYSKKLLGHMGRCFGTVDRTRLSAETNDAFLKCVLGERMHSIRQVDQSLSDDDFPKETTFQHLFTLGLLNNTTFETAICSELSRSFATSTTVKGEIDFFVDGDRMWGIELARSGANIGERMSRFGPGGKYAGLQSKDDVVLDFRKGVTNVRQDPRRATASFLIDDATGRTRFGEVVVKQCMFPNSHFCLCIAVARWTPSTTITVTVRTAATNQSQAPVHKSIQVRQFQCKSPRNRRDRQQIALSFVGDGVCDCCDGSDEPQGLCANTCVQRRQLVMESMEAQLQMMRTAGPMYDAYVAAASARIQALQDELATVSATTAALQRAFQYKQQALQALMNGADPKMVEPPQEQLHELQQMYHQLNKWQLRAYVLEKLLSEDDANDGGAYATAGRQVFAPLVGQCFPFTVNEKQLKGGSSNVIPREYVIVFCPFQNVTQTEPAYAQWQRAETQSKTGLIVDEEPHHHHQPPILMGVWDKWTYGTRLQRFDHGEPCINGQNRVVDVDMRCGAENRVVAVEELEMCVYSLAFETPAACLPHIEGTITFELDLYTDEELDTGPYEEEEVAADQPGKTHEEL